MQKSPCLKKRQEEFKSETKTESEEESPVAKLACSAKSPAYARTRKTKGSAQGMPRKAPEQRG